MRPQLPPLRPLGGSDPLSLYKYKALGSDFYTQFLRETSAKIVRENPKERKKERERERPAVERGNRGGLGCPGEDLIVGDKA